MHEDGLSKAFSKLDESKQSRIISKVVDNTNASTLQSHTSVNERKVWRNQRNHQLRGGCRSQAGPTGDMGDRGEGIQLYDGC